MLERRFTRSLWCACAWLAVALPAAAQSLTLPQALLEARANLDVAIARGGLEAARADILAANHAPLPVLSAKVSSIDLQNGIGAGPLLTRKRLDKGVGLDWTWERGDKRALRTRAANEAVGAAQEDLQDVVVQQLLATQGSFYDLLAAQQKLELMQALVGDARQLADTAARRVRAGDLARQDANRIEIEAERVRADALAADLDRQRAALVLAQLVGRMPQAERLAVDGGWPAAAAPGDADLAALVQDRADVRAAVARVRAAQAAVDNARALRKSDVTVGASFDHYPGTSNRLVEVRAQMPLTWGYDYQGEIGRALAQLRQAEDQLEKTRRTAAADLRRLQLEAATALARARHYETEVLPRAREVAQSAEIAYQKGALPLTDLLDARRTLRATLLDALSTRVDAAKAAAAWQLRAQPLSPEFIAQRLP